MLEVWSYAAHVAQALRMHAYAQSCIRAHYSEAMPHNALTTSCMRGTAGLIRLC